jgi:hypothetical protein
MFFGLEERRKDIFDQIIVTMTTFLIVDWVVRMEVGPG